MTHTNDKKYSRIRMTLIGLPIFIAFLLYLLSRYLVPDYLVAEKDLMTDSGVFQNAYKTTYRAYDKYKGYYNHPCVKIELLNKPFFVRLDDKKHWSAILDSNNQTKQIELKYQKRLMKENMLVNPNQISIDGTLIYSYTERRQILGWFSIAVSIGTVVCCFLLRRVLKIYKQNLLDYDKQLWQTNKLTLIKTWVLR